MALPKLRHQTTIFPLHQSARGRRLMPHGMTVLRVDGQEHVEWLERMALEIFSDMVNAGRTFQEALATIYLSGLHHAQALAAEKSEAAQK